MLCHRRGLPGAYLVVPKRLGWNVSAPRAIERAKREGRRMQTDLEFPQGCDKKSHECPAANERLFVPNTSRSQCDAAPLEL